MKLELGEDLTASFIEQHIERGITIKKGAAKVHTTKEELKDLCRQANREMADGITVTSLRFLDGVADRVKVFLTTEQVNALFAEIGWD